MEGQYRILIIDDNAGFAENLKDILSEHQYAVSIAGNGKSATELVKKKEFDLVLIDIKLPDILGLDLVDRMSKLAPNQEYIIITGYGTMENAIEAVKHKKIVSFEVKPIDNLHLLYLIQQLKEKKLAAEALHISEERFRIFSESASDAFLTFNEQGTVISVNPEFENIFGYAPREIICKPLHLIIPTHPDLFGRQEKKNNRRSPVNLSSGKRIEVNGRHKSGREIPLEISFGQYHSLEGNFYTTIIRDITDRKIEEVKNQQRLEAEKISSLISERFVGIADFSKAVEDTLCDVGQYCDASRAFLILTTDSQRHTRKTYEWSSDNLPGRKRKKEKQVPLYENFIREFATGLDLIITDVNKVPPNEAGIKKYLLAAGVQSLFLLPLFAKGNLIGYWGMDNFIKPEAWTVEKFNLVMVISNIFSNAFHRRFVEQELAASEEIHRILLNASQEGIVIMDHKGRITEVSDIAMKLLGEEKKEKIIGRSYLEYVPKHLHKTVKEIFTKIFEDGNSQNTEFEFVKPDQTMINAEVSATLIPEMSGGPKGLMLAIRDITHRKTIEKQMIHTERMAGIGEMAAGIAHEINQPLNTISLTLDNLLFAFKNGQFDKEYLETKTHKLFQNITRMKNIIDHVRTFSRQNDDYILGNFNVNDSIRNAVSMVSEQFKHKGINLILNLDENIRLPIGNTYKFEQVILNLIINAKDAIEEKKKKLQKDYNKTIEIVTFERSSSIFVEVTDNGTGIDPDKVDKVFLPFYTSKETGTGTGLGLSISFGIIKDMHGSIEVESKLNKGTTIKITVPVDARKKVNPAKDEP
jgi:PAS domain S-box-containing protein